MEQEQLGAIQTSSPEEVVGLSPIPAAEPINDDIVAQGEASPSTIASHPHHSHSQPSSNLKSEDEKDTPQHEHNLLQQEGNPPEEEDILQQEEDIPQQEEVTHQQEGKSQEDNDNPPKTTDNPPKEIHEATFVFVDHLDNSLTNSAFILPSTDYSRSQSLKTDSFTTLTESVRAFRDENTQHDINMPRLLSTFCQKICLLETMEGLQLARAGWLAQCLFHSLQQDSRISKPESFPYGISGIKLVDKATQLSQFKLRQAGLRSAYGEWGSDPGSGVKIWLEDVQIHIILRCLVEHESQQDALLVFVELKHPNYLRHFRAREDFYDVIAATYHIYHHAAHFVASRNNQDVQSADKARSEFQNITKEIIPASQQTQGNPSELFKAQPQPLYQRLNTVEQASTSQEVSEASLQQQQNAAKDTKTAEKKAAKKLRKERAKAAKAAEKSSESETDKAGSTLSSTQEEDNKAAENIAGDGTENVSSASSPGAQLAVVASSSSPSLHIGREPWPKLPAIAPTPHHLTFSYRLPYHMTACWLADCLRPTSCEDGMTVICPRCGPESWVRYCCVTHLFMDVKTHWQKYCGRRLNLLPIDASTVPPAAGPQGEWRKYVSPVLREFTTFESHRQALYRSMGSPLHDYHIFGDLDVLWGATDDDREPSKEVLNIFRGTGGVFCSVALPAGQEKEQLNAALNLALSQGRAAGDSGVMPRAHLEFAFSAIKENLKLLLLCDERMMDRVCLQFQLEFGFVVPPRLIWS